MASERKPNNLIKLHQLSNNKTVSYNYSSLWRHLLRCYIKNREEINLFSSILCFFFDRLFRFYKGHFNSRKRIVLWNNRLFSSLFLSSFVLDFDRNLFNISWMHMSRYCIIWTTFVEIKLWVTRREHECCIGLISWKSKWLDNINPLPSWN